MSLGDNRSESTIVVGEYNSKVLLYSRQRDRDLSLIQKPNESCVKHMYRTLFFSVRVKDIIACYARMEVWQSLRLTLG